jgi:hypothetical protein
MQLQARDYRAFGATLSHALDQRWSLLSAGR